MELPWAEMCFKKCIYKPKSSATEIPEVFVTFSHTIKMTYDQGQDPDLGQNGPDPTGSGDATLLKGK
jgi:hypothetical protein